MVQCLDGVRQLLAVLLKCCDVELKQPPGLEDPQVLARETVCKPDLLPLPGRCFISHARGMN